MESEDYLCQGSEDFQNLDISDIFGEKFSDKCERIREASPFGNLMTWKLIELIVKQGCDLRQEQFAMQLISQFNQIFHEYKLDIWLMPYEIITTGPNSGLMQCVPNAMSLHALNRKLRSLQITNLNKFFCLYYNTPAGKILTNIIQ